MIPVVVKIFLIGISRCMNARFDLVAYVVSSIGHFLFSPIRKIKYFMIFFRCPMLICLQVLAKILSGIYICRDEHNQAQSDVVVGLL